MRIDRIFLTLAAMTLVAGISAPSVADSENDDSATKAPSRVAREELRCHDSYDPTVKFGGLKKGATYQSNQVISVFVTISCPHAKHYEETGQYDGVVFDVVLVNLTVGVDNSELLTTVLATDHPYSIELDLNERLPGEYLLVLAEPDANSYLFSTKVYFKISGNTLQVSPSDVLDVPHPEIGD